MAKKKVNEKQVEEVKQEKKPVKTYILNDGQLLKVIYDPNEPAVAITLTDGADEYNGYISLKKSKE